MSLKIKSPFNFERAFAMVKVWFGKIWDDKYVIILRDPKNLVVNRYLLYAKR